MPSTYSPNLRLELIASGEQANTWGNTTNTNLGTLLESAITGYVSLTSMTDANYTLTALNGANDQARQMYIDVPISAGLTASRNIVAPTVPKVYVIRNNGGNSVVIKTSSGTGVTIPNGITKTVACDGTNFSEVITGLEKLYLGTAVTSGSASNQATTKLYVDTQDALKLSLTGGTMTGAIVLPSTSPTGYQAVNYAYLDGNFIRGSAGSADQIVFPHLRLQYAPSYSDDAVTVAYVAATYVNLTGTQTISGAKTFSANVALNSAATLTLAQDPTLALQAATKQYVDNSVSNIVTLSGNQTITGTKTFSAPIILSGGGTYITIPNAPIADTDAANALYVDDQIDTRVPTTRLISAGSSAVSINGVFGGSATLSNDITINVAAVTVPVTAVGAVAPVLANGVSGTPQTGTVNISMPAASGSASGYLSNSDWTTFNNKQAAIGYTPANVSGANATGAWAGGVAWAGVTGKPTTVAGYGITDAITTGNIGTQTVATANAAPWSGLTGAAPSNSIFSNGAGYITSGSLSSYVAKSGDTMTGALTLSVSGTFPTLQTYQSSTYSSRYATIGYGQNTAFSVYGCVFNTVSPSFGGGSGSFDVWAVTQQNASYGSPIPRFSIGTGGSTNVYGNLNVFADTTTGTQAGNLVVAGTITAGTKPFRIPHPVVADKDLVHIAVESPRADMLYRGVVKLTDGYATVEIDANSNMTDGTFAAFTQNVEVVALHNKDGFTRVKASEVVQGTFHITAEDATCTDNIAWMVVAERSDPFMKELNLTDINGRLMPEQDKLPVVDPILGA